LFFSNVVVKTGQHQIAEAAILDATRIPSVLLYLLHISTPYVLLYQLISALQCAPVLETDLLI
jgi:hypothetical protein